MKENNRPDLSHIKDELDGITFEQFEAAKPSNNNKVSIDLVYGINEDFQRDQKNTVGEVLIVDLSSIPVGFTIDDWIRHARQKGVEIASSHEYPYTPDEVFPKLILDPSLSPNNVEFLNEDSNTETLNLE